MAVMLKVTVFIDGFPFIPQALVYFIPCNQLVTLLIAADILWHVSCLLLYLQCMNTTRFLLPQEVMGRKEHHEIKFKKEWGFGVNEFNSFST